MERIYLDGEKIAIEVIDGELLGYELTEKDEPIFESIFVIDDWKQKEIKISEELRDILLLSEDT